MPSPTRATTALLLAAVVMLGAAAPVLAHNGEPVPTPRPPKAPLAPQSVGLETILPPRWSWLHWWEANRERYLHSPSQDQALQPPDEAYLKALRDEAAQALLKALENPGRDVVVIEAAIALGKMRQEAALPALKRLAETGDTTTVRRAALTGIGLLGSEAAEKALGQYTGTKVEERVAALAAVGLMPKISDATLHRLRGAVSSDVPAIATVVCWSFRQHQRTDDLEFYRGLLKRSDSPWVASEALLGLGRTRDRETVRLLEDTMFATSTQHVRALDELEKLHKNKLSYAARASGRQGSYDQQYEQYLDQHKRFWGNSPNAPAPTAKGSTMPAITLAIGYEQIRIAWLRASAAIALGEIDHPSAGTSLMRFLKEDPSRDPYIVMPMGFAIMSLASYPSDQSRDRLIPLLGKQDENGKLRLDGPKDSPLRGFAALALGLYAKPYDTPQGPADRPGYDWAIMTLAERLDDEREDEEVRTACAIALGLTQRTSVLPVLHRISTRMQERNRRADSALHGFVLLGRSLAGDTNVVEPAAKFLLDREDDTSASGILSRRAAVLALGVTRSPIVVPVLTKAWHLNHYVNREVIVALRLVGAASAANPVLERLRETKDAAERAYMAQALGELLSREQPSALTRLTAWSNYTVRNENLLPLQTLSNEFLFDYLIKSFGEDW
ncbi:MAG TPA: HEAT repeat domain-containing protein [Tepidisphaeraceae bacterium]|nr:HEAT repeat domain-containing protein [Tepidisphaeraceae bacterium]